jgi:predicted nucleic acid binding AN1-type Zn finger protein
VLQAVSNKITINNSSMNHAEAPSINGIHARGRAASGAMTCSQEAHDGFVSKSCAFSACRKGIFCAFACKHCSQDFCEEHQGTVAHSCTAAATADRRALTCSACGVLVIEYEVLAAIDGGAKAEYGHLAKRLRQEREHILEQVREKLTKAAKLSGNVYSFSSTMATLSEDEAPYLVSHELRANLQRLEQAKCAHLLALHASHCCPCNRASHKDVAGRDQSGVGISPASHKKAKCGMRNCKSKCSSAFLQHCKRCDRHFCLSHRLPEVHTCA